MLDGTTRTAGGAAEDWDSRSRVAQRPSLRSVWEITHRLLVTTWPPTKQSLATASSL